MFEVGAQHDAQELLIALLDILHHEIHMTLESSDSLTPVTQVFGCVISITVQCNVCDFTKTNIETVPHLSVVVPEISGTVTVEDLFLEYFAPEVINDWKCHLVICKHIVSVSLEKHVPSDLLSNSSTIFEFNKN